MRKKTKIEESSIFENNAVSVVELMLLNICCPPSSEDDSNSDQHSISGSDDGSDSDISYL